MYDPDEITGIKDSRTHISQIAGLIGTTYRNRRLLLRSELLEGLNEAKTSIVEWFFNVKSEDFGLHRPYYGIDEPRDVSIFEIIERTLPDLNSEDVPDIQYVPKPIFSAYDDMQRKLMEDMGGRIMISSAYRSPAFQVLVLCYSIKRHGFDIAKTLSLVGLPGYSEHGLIDSCALDFQLGGENYVRPDRTAAFADSREFAWLKKHAGEFGFNLSYPQDSQAGLPFEPWHWRYLPKTG